MALCWEDPAGRQNLPAAGRYRSARSAAYRHRPGTADLGPVMATGHPGAAAAGASRVRQCQEARLTRSAVRREHHHVLTAADSNGLELPVAMSGLVVQVEVVVVLHRGLLLNGRLLLAVDERVGLGEERRAVDREGGR